MTINYGTLGSVSETRPFYPGDNVRFNEQYAAKYPGVLRVERVNPRTLSLIDVNGAKVKTDPYLVSHTDDLFEMKSPDEIFHLGDTVKFASHARVKESDKSKTYVVIKHGTAPGSVNVAQLNGGDDRYYRSINISVLEKVAL